MTVLRLIYLRLARTLTDKANEYFRAAEACRAMGDTYLEAEFYQNTAETYHERANKLRDRARQLA